MINPEKISLIRTKVNIIDVIGEHLKLHKKGRNYWTICPFHEDSAPSMSVSTEKQIYRCFSCQASGNVFTFLQEYQKIPFLDALKALAARVDVDLSELKTIPKKVDDEATKVFLLNQLACEYYMYNLTLATSTKARDYLATRKIDQDLITQFKIGLAATKNGLVTYFQQKGYEPVTLVNSGLVVYKNNQFQDYFLNRIIFPIADIDNNIIGFASRSYLPGQNPKYVNTLETKFFKKNQLLYNLSQAKKAVSKNKYLIICEGFMDVIALNRINIQNCIAIMGTNLSDVNCKILRAITPEIRIFLDGDDPGVNATFKIVLQLLRHNFIVKVVNNLEPLDPDDLVTTRDRAVVQDLIASAVPPLDFVINYYEKKFDLTMLVNVKDFFEKIAPFYKILNELEKNFYLNKLITLTKLEKTVVLNALGVSQRSQQVLASAVPKKRRVISNNAIFNALEKAENSILFALLSWKITLINQPHEMFYLVDDKKRKLLELIIRWYQNHPEATTVDYDAFLESITDPAIKAILVLIKARYFNQGLSYQQQFIFDCQQQIYEHFKNQQIKELITAIQQEPNQDQKLALAAKVLQLSKNVKIEKSD